MTVLALIFLTVPLIVYARFSEADEAQKALLLHNARDQGRVIAAALEPLLAQGPHPDLPILNQTLARFGADGTEVKVIFSPANQAGFYYVGAWPPVSNAQTEAERDELAHEGVLPRLASTCQGDFPFALRYEIPDGSDEIVTSVTPLKTVAGCWAVVTSFAAATSTGALLARPYWQSPDVQTAAAIYLAMVVLTFTTFWSIRRGLRRFADRASAIRERRPGSTFKQQNEVPELADVAEEFDRMVEVLASSARDLRRAAEDNAHAFKTPIAVIRQSLEPLKRGIDPANQRAARAVGLIEGSLDRLDGLVESVRNLDQATADLIEAPRTEIDLSALIISLLQAQVEGLAARGIAIRARIQPKIAIYAQEETVETVFENLFENAVSFAPEGESIAVTLAIKDGMAELGVADAGPGVPNAYVQRIFDRYFSLRPEGQHEDHSGLGLWIARRNIESLGGTIAAENRKPHGLLIRVRLPLAEHPRMPPVGE